MLRRLRSTSLLAGLTLGLLPAPARAGTLAAGTTRLEWASDPQLGVVLQALGDQQQAQAFSLVPGELWTVELRDAAGTVLPLGPSDATASFSLLEQPDGFEATWSGVTHAALPPGASIDVVVGAHAAAGEPLVLLSIAITTHTPAHALWAVRFPRLRVGARGAPKDALMIPLTEGIGLWNPTAAVLPLDGALAPQVHPGPLSMQWLAYYDTAEADPALLFAGTRDATGHRKEYELGRADSSQPPDGTTDTLTLAVRQMPADAVTPDGDWNVPYAFVLGVLRGDWYDAARAYRAWAVAQPWTAAGPMRSRPSFSSLLAAAQMAATTGPVQAPADYAYWPGMLAEQHSTFGTSEVPTFLYGWHNNTFDQDWGDWFPIAPELVTYGPLVAAQGDDFAPYFFPLVYSKGVPSYAASYVPGFVGQPVEPFALRDAAGAVVEVSDSAGKPAVSLCMATDFASAYATHVAERLNQEASARGIYLDVFSFAAADACFAQNHGHAPGAGDHSTSGKRALVATLRQTLRQTEPQFFVYSEAQNEMFVDLLELTFAHNTGYLPSSLRFIAPLFETVYHDYQLTGRVGGVQGPASLPIASDPEQMRELRRAWVAEVHFGHAPFAGGLLSSTTLADLAAMPATAPFVETIQRHMAVLAQAHVRDHFLFGERLREPPTDSPGVDLSTQQFLPLGDQQPLVYASAWSTPEPGLGVLLLNWTAAAEDEGGGVMGGDRLVKVAIDPAEYGLGPGVYLLQTTSETGISTSGGVDLGSTAEIAVTVPERAARFLRLSPMAADAGAPDAATDAASEAGAPDASDDVANETGVPDAASDAGSDAGAPDASDDVADEAGEDAAGNAGAGGDDSGGGAGGAAAGTGGGASTAPAAGASSDDGGCACRQAAARSEQFLAPAALLAMLGVRRRRRR